MKEEEEEEMEGFFNEIRYPLKDDILTNLDLFKGLQSEFYALQMNQRI